MALLTSLQICEVRAAQDCYFSDEETLACVEEAHKAGKSICAHARARDSVKMCIKVRPLLATSSKKHS
jgi:imidazolonepropionase-like amidohydrolase